MIGEAIAKHYLNIFSNQVKNENERLFGLEIELTIVSLSDYKIITSVSIIEELLLEIALKKNWKAVYDNSSKRIIRVESSEASSDYKASIGPDFSVSTLEISTSPESSLRKQIESTLSICKEVNAIANKNGFGLVAGGLHPFTNPNQAQIYSSNSRYVKTLLSEEAPQLICQSLQFTFNVNADELVKMYSTFQKLVPLFTKFFGSSPICDGKITNKNSFREWHYLQRSFIDSRYGFGPDIQSINDYYNLIINYPLSRLVRDGKMLFFNSKIPFRDFCMQTNNDPKYRGSNFNFEHIWDDFVLFESTIWHNIRIRSKIGGIEIRSIDSLPIAYLATFTSFIRGLIANIDEVVKYMDKFKFKNLSWLHYRSVTEGLTNDTYTQQILPHLVLLAEKGLLLIDEEICIGHLDKLKKIILDKKNISDQISEEYMCTHNPEERFSKIMSILYYH